MNRNLHLLAVELVAMRVFQVLSVDQPDDDLKCEDRGGTVHRTVRIQVCVPHCTFSCSAQLHLAASGGKGCIPLHTPG